MPLPHGRGSLSRNLPVPLYHQLKTILMTGIESGEWQTGQQIPTEEDLSKRFGISKITVRQALRELAGLGYVRREQGRGTFVSRPKLSQGPRELTSFTEEMRRHNLTADSRVLNQSVREADEAAAGALQITAGDAVFVLTRLRLADGEPMGVQIAHIPARLVPGLVDEPFEGGSLYETLQSRYGLQAARARETHFALLAPVEYAELLGIAAGSPALGAERIAYLSSGEPLEYVESIMRGDRYRIVLDLVS
jgi:GntR family transcriptional regulator, N-acetylglucosamine utilization regulator